MKRISIDNALDILSIIGEEDSIGLDKNQAVQDAIELIQNRIEQLIEAHVIDRNDTLVEFI